MSTQEPRVPRVDSLQIVFPEDVHDSTHTNVTTPSSSPPPPPPPTPTPRSPPSSSSSSQDFVLHPPPVVQSVIGQLRSLGFIGARAFVAQGYPLEILVETIVDVKQGVHNGTVDNPGGLIRYLMREACPWVVQENRR